jgi:hypothetical protein
MRVHHDHRTRALETELTKVVGHAVIGFANLKPETMRRTQGHSATHVHRRASGTIRRDENTNCWRPATFRRRPPAHDNTTESPGPCRIQGNVGRIFFVFLEKPLSRLVEHEPVGHHVPPVGR